MLLLEHVAVRVSTTSKFTLRTVAGSQPTRLQAFTAIELMVVMAIIILVLAFGIPAFNNISVQSRQSAAVQILNGVCTRAYTAAITNKSLTAVRLLPAAWDQDASAGNGAASDLSKYQKAITYRWVSSYEDPNPGNGNISRAIVDERFERMIDGPEGLLPGDTWAAPVEALDGSSSILRNGVRLGDATLSGRINTTLNPSFAFDPNAAGETFFDADDFLLVFDPKSGLVPNQAQQLWRLKAYDANTSSPTYRQETCGSWTGAQYSPAFQRFNYTGVVIYRREPMLALGTSESVTPAARRGVLERHGKPYFVNRSGGTLMAGN